MRDGQTAMDLTDRSTHAVVSLGLHLVILADVLALAVVDCIVLDVLVESDYINDILVTLLLPFFSIFHSRMSVILSFL